MKDWRALLGNDVVFTDISSMILRHCPEFEQLFSMKSDDLETECFFDHFSIHNSIINKEYLNRSCEIEDEFEDSFGYEKGVKFYDPEIGLRFFLYTGSINESPWEYKIQLIKTRAIESYDELKSIFELIMGFVSRDNHAIARADLGFALSENQITPDLLHLTTHFNWKRGESVYNNRTDYHNGRITGICSTGQGARINLYSENSKIKCKGGDRRRDGQLKAEIQVRKQALQKKEICSIYDLWKIPDTNLLDRVAFYNPVWMDSYYSKRIEKFKFFQEKVFRLGFLSARKILNPNRNFKREF